MKDNLINTKKYAIANLVMTVAVLILSLYVIPSLFWIENPDGDYTYETVEDAIEMIIIPIVINMILTVNMFVSRKVSDKWKIFAVGILGIFVNFFQARLVIDTAVAHFRIMSLDGGNVARSYVFINSVWIVIGVISVAMLFGYIMYIMSIRLKR